MPDTPKPSLDDAIAAVRRAQRIMDAGCCAADKRDYAETLPGLRAALDYLSDHERVVAERDALVLEWNRIANKALEERDAGPFTGGRDA